MDATVGVVFLIAGLIIYFVPSIVAMMANRQNTTAICLLNIFLGWTLIGWVGALVWASTSAPKPKEAQ